MIKSADLRRVGDVLHVIWC